MNIAGKAHVGEIIQKIAVETPCLREPLDVPRREFEIVKKIEGLIQSGCDEKTAARRKLAREELEDRRAGFSALDVRLRHGKLVDVGQEGASRNTHVPILLRDLGRCAGAERDDTA